MLISELKTIPPIFDLCKVDEEVEINDFDIKAINRDYDLEKVDTNNLKNIICRRGYYGLNNKQECEELVWRDGDLAESELFNHEMKSKKIKRSYLSFEYETPRFYYVSTLKKLKDLCLYNELLIYYKGDVPSEQIFCRRDFIIDLLKEKENYIFKNIVFTANLRYIKWAIVHVNYQYIDNIECIIWNVGAYGDLEIFKVIFSLYKGHPDIRISEYAAYGGSVDILKFLKEKEYPFGFHTRINATEKNQTEVLKYLDSIGYKNSIGI